MASERLKIKALYWKCRKCLRTERPSLEIFWVPSIQGYRDSIWFIHHKCLELKFKEVPFPCWIMLEWDDLSDEYKDSLHHFQVLFNCFSAFILKRRMGIARHVTTQLLRRLMMTQTTNWLHKISQSSQQKTELPQHTTGKKVLLMQFVWLINLGKERRNK